MWKKILIGVFIGLSIFAINSFSHATLVSQPEKVEASLEQKVDLSKYIIIKPEKRQYAIETKVDFINGIAPKDTVVTIQIFGTTDLTRKNFNLMKLPSEEDYIEVFSEEIIVGNSGIFSKQLELVTGINKVLVIFDEEDLEPEEIIIFVNPNNTIRDLKRPEKLLELILKS